MPYPTSSLVTGGSGFLGQHLVRVLRQQQGAQVTVVTRSMDRSVGDEICRADLATNQPDLRGRSYEVVYHLAGQAHCLAVSREQRRRFSAVNTVGTENLLASLERMHPRPRAIVYASSVAVYGRDEGSLLEEDTPRNATDPYGASKRAAEDVLSAWCQEHAVRCAIVRLPLVVGAGAPGNFGAMARAIRRRRYVGVGSGEARHSMVLADDVARILPRLADTGGTYHLTDGYHPSFAELEQALSQALDRQPPRHLPLTAATAAAWFGGGLQAISGLPMPLTPHRLRKMTATLTFSDARVRRIVGWQPGRVLERVGTLLATNTPAQA